MTSILYGAPRGYHCRHAPWYAFVEIFEVLWSDGPPDRKEEKKLKEEAEKKTEEAREEGKEEKWIVVGQRGRRRVVLFGKQPNPMTLMPFFRRLRPVARGAILHQLRDLPPGVLIFLFHPKCICIFKMLSFLNE